MKFANEGEKTNGEHIKEKQNQREDSNHKWVGKNQIETDKLKIEAVSYYLLKQDLKKSLTWQHMPIVSVLRRLRQENFKLENNWKSSAGSSFHLKAIFSLPQVSIG